jgi:membrane-associated phospholipid phosphatase
MNKTHYLILLITLLSVGGCVTPGAEWGRASTFSPGWDHVKQSAATAVKSPHIWVPLAGAALFSIGDFDEDTLDWAIRHHPLSSDRQDAVDISDNLKTLSKLNYLLTALTVPADSISSRTKGVVGGLAAIQINHAITEGLKSVTDRKRPDKDANDSFPSLHASEASIAATLAARNIDYFGFSKPAKVTWQVSSYTVAGLTAWMRVEGNRHYPSDVLVGYALGHFLGAFLNDAFINPAYQENFRLGISSTPEGDALLSVDLRW